MPAMDPTIFPAWKRLFDMLFSVAVIVLTSPVWGVIALLVKMQDGGPVFYKDLRIGEHGTPFKCWKFRTMQVDAAKRLHNLLEDEPALKQEYEDSYKLKEDPRVTRFGRFLRKTSLDELPQFLNVIAGEMSVVGIRPVLPLQFETHYQELALSYCGMKPGITGIWQVGKRNDIENFQERIELDRQYLSTCSFRLDMKLIAKTVWHIFRPNGAY